MSDSQYGNIRYGLSETEHRYGKNIHILSNPYLLSQLALLCSEKTFQPTINELVTRIYSSLIEIALNSEFPLTTAEARTRMAATHAKEGVYRGPVLDSSTRAVCVNLARAGTVPSQVCYMALNYALTPDKVRQDHISIARTTNDTHQVTGSAVSGHKIGGSVDDSIVLFPDPMGATGGTLAEAIDLYKKHGKAKKYVALHCIVTPEYLKKIQARHPDLAVYAVRLDRGLSPQDVLQTVPGTHWERERGLNDMQYIVPGGGGFGEIMNNAYV